jgi:hypothetical protein
MRQQLSRRVERLGAMSALVVAASMLPHKICVIKLLLAEVTKGVLPSPMMAEVIERGETFAADVASAV